MKKLSNLIRNKRKMMKRERGGDRSALGDVVDLTLDDHRRGFLGSEPRGP